MENNFGNNISPDAVSLKSRWALIIILIALSAAVMILAAVNYFSFWKCAGGEWVRQGFPLSREPQEGCQSDRTAENLTGRGEVADIKETEKSTDSFPETSLKFSEIEKPEISGLEVRTLRSGDAVSSPLIIEGRAKGSWYFEGSFPVKILDRDFNVLAQSYADAEDDWMDKDWVDFRSEIKFSNPATESGFVLFSVDNPSGIASLDYAIAIPVKFKFAGTHGIQPLLSGQCGRDPLNDPILGDCGEDCNTDNWKVYTNKKYGYSFRYPADYVLSSNCKNKSCVSVEEGGDSVYLSGEHILGDWPIIHIRHLQNEHYNPPAQTDTVGWIQEKFPWVEKCFPVAQNIYFPLEKGQALGGFNIYFPASPQAHSRREIFYAYRDKIFQIEMLDVDSPQARQFYNIWMSEFRIIGEGK